MGDTVNDTILDMVKNLKSTVEIRSSTQEFISLKRSVSSMNSNDSSIEEATPVKRLKRESQMDLSYIGSPREMRRLRADLLEARNTIKALESRISHMHCVQKEMQLMFDEENQVLKRQNEYNNRTIEGLENQLQSIRKRESELKADLIKVNDKYNLLKMKTSEQIEKLEKTVEDFKEESRQLMSEEHSAVPKLERKIAALETMLEAAQEDAEAQKKLATELEGMIRQESRPFDLPQERFIELFRLNKELCLTLIQMVEPYLQDPVLTLRKVSKDIIVLAALRFYATGAYQRTIGQDLNLGLSQTSVHRCIHKVTDIIDEHLAKLFIKFPNTSRKRQEIKVEFMNKYGFPGVVGAVDGTHIAILKPEVEEHNFINRKGFHSLNVQVVSDEKKRLAEHNASERNLEQKEQALQRARLQIKELEYAKETFLEYQGQAKTQAHKLAHYAELEKENAQLKEENARIRDAIQNKLLLEEEVNDLKNRLVKYKEQEKKLAQESQNAMYLSEWRAVARGICESTDSDAALPHLLRSAVERLQTQELALTSEKVELESQLKTALFVNSYERDLTMCVNTSTTGTAANQLQSQKERIENLEKIVEGYRDMVSKLENDLQTIQPIQSDVVPARADQIARLQNEIRQLKNENDKLRDKKDELEMQLESYVVGQDSLRGGEVLHLANNPLTECIAQRESYIEKLEQDVERLKKKIKNLEKGFETSKLSDTISNPHEVNALKEQLKAQESQAQMLKEYFKSQMQEFRNVIYMLLGYKIDRTQALYKLRSMYAERSEDHLCFQVNKEGELNLLENEYSATLEEMINLHLRHQKSIPVFLSAITMDLFNSKTMTKTIQIE
nr:unnamed protein product [Callosobruchus analis]